MGYSRGFSDSNQEITVPVEDDLNEDEIWEDIEKAEQKLDDYYDHLSALEDQLYEIDEEDQAGILTLENSIDKMETTIEEKEEEIYELYSLLPSKGISITNLLLIMSGVSALMVIPLILIP